VIKLPNTIMCSLEESINQMNKLSLNERSLTATNDIIHSKNAILTSGEYKGYSCFITDVTPICVELQIEEISYVLVEENDNKKIGEKANANGTSVIVDIIPEMYEITNVKNGVNIRLPVEAFMVVIVLKNGDILQKNGNKYYKKNKKITNEEDINERMLFDKEDVKDVEVFFCEKENNEEIYNMYAMVVDKKYTEFYGNNGRLLRKIGKQHVILFNRSVIFKKSMTKHLKNDFFLVKVGIYKNKIGKLVKTYDNNFSVTLNTNGKKISEIYVKKGDEYFCRKIVKDDLFKIDIILKSGKYIEVKEYSQNLYVGKEFQTNVQKTIRLDEIEILDLQIREKTKKEETKEEEINEEEINEEEINEEEINEEEFANENANEICDDALEEKKENQEDDDDEKEIDQYDDEVVENNNEVENFEVEMKSGFKDSARLNTMEKKLSEKENDILKTIEKCKRSFEYDTENTYAIIDKVNECIDLFKNDLLKISKAKNTDLVKKTDYTFIVALFVLYDLVKSGFAMQKSFNDYIEKLYNDGYLKGTFISGSIFLRKDKTEQLSISNIFSKIQMSESEYDSTKELLKKKKHLNVLKIMVNNCDKLLQDIFGKVVFNYDNKIEYIPIIRNNRKYNYPKYFITSKDLVSNNISSEATHILHGPLINKWIAGLREKQKKINDQEKKNIYKFIIDNFYKAPIILNNVDITSDIKYIELQRVYTKFVSKVDIHLKEKDIVRKKRIERKNKELSKIMSNRKIETLKMLC